MPKEIQSIQDFLKIAKRPDAKIAFKKKTGNVTKLKIRCSRYLYTLKVADQQKADKLWDSVPPGVKKQEN